MTYNTISDYLFALQKWNEIPAKITRGKMLLWVKNRWVGRAEFYAHNSVPVYEPLPRIGLDGSVIQRGVITKENRRKGRK